MIELPLRTCAAPDIAKAAVTLQVTLQGSQLLSKRDSSQRPHSTAEDMCDIAAQQHLNAEVDDADSHFRVATW